MQDQERDQNGRFEEKVMLEGVLAMFGGGEPITATDVADNFDISNRAALNKLETLEDKGEIERKNVGSRAVVWWKGGDE